MSTTQEADIFSAYEEAELTEEQVVAGLRKDKGDEDELPKPVTSFEIDSNAASTSASPEPPASDAGDASASIPDAEVHKVADIIYASQQLKEEAAEPVRTDAGLIDPETGELLEESLIMRKFGWATMPNLPPKAMSSEVQLFEKQLDQVLDLVLTYQERCARYRAAAEERCKALEGPANFFTEVFIEPMARQLAEHRLPRYKSGAKKGEFSKKLLPLASGLIRFRQEGGFSVFDSDLLKTHIENEGVEKFAAIGAKKVVQYQHQKLISALNKGVLRDLPGTKCEPKNPLGKVRVCSPQSAATNEEEEE